MDIARNIAAGNGAALSDFGATAPWASPHFPPGYPALLAATGAARDFAAARLLHVGLVFATALLAGALAWRVVRSAGLAALVAAWVVLTPDAQAVFAVIGSESPFVPLCLLAVLLAGAGRIRGWALPLAGAAAGAAILARHAGLFLIIPLIAAGLARGPGRRNFVGAIGAVMLAMSGWALWHLWLWRHSSEVARVLAWHPPGRAEALATLETFGGWLLPAALPARVALGALLALLWTAAAWRILKRRRRMATVGGVAAVSAGAYVAFLVAARALADEAIPLAGRLWLPMLPLVAVTLIAAVPRRRAALALGLMAIVGASAWASWQQAATFRRNGIGYSSPHWRDSPTLAFVATLPRGAPVLTDGPDVIGLLLDRPALMLPTTNFRSALAVNRHWRRQLRELGHQVIAGDGIVVFFDGIDRDSYLATEAQVREYFRLELVADLPDGRVYRILGPAQPTLPAQAADQSRGSTGSLSRASTAKTHS